MRRNILRLKACKSVGLLQRFDRLITRMNGLSGIVDAREHELLRGCCLLQLLC